MKPIFNIKFNVTAKFHKAAKKKKKNKKKQKQKEEEEKKGKIILSTFLHVPSIWQSIYMHCLPRVARSPLLQIISNTNKVNVLPFN